MDPLTLALASFSQKLASAKAQYNINFLLKQMKIVTQLVYDNLKMYIGVEYLGTFCSVLFGFRKFNKINDIAHLLRIPGISVTSTPGT